MPVDEKDDIVDKDSIEEGVVTDTQDDMPDLVDGVEEVEDIGEGGSVIVEVVANDAPIDTSSMDALISDTEGLISAFVGFKKNPTPLMKQTLRHKLTGVTLAKRRVDIDIKEQTA